ncbi:hypothetical protein JXO59_12580 [candidate division KSB1 bacterium]|nr:hypothetical protein [candidate division KSB1 bacterium]
MAKRAMRFLSLFTLPGTCLLEEMSYKNSGGDNHWDNPADICINMPPEHSSTTKMIK